MVLVYIGASVIGALAGAAALGPLGAPLGALVAGVLSAVFVLNRE